MKKINFNQLFMSWNEKQKPRRIGRYAVMLLMLLTLGVGQMWANYAYLDLTGFTDWTGSNAWFRMTFGSTNCDSRTEIATNVWRFNIGDNSGSCTYKRMEPNSENQWNWYNGSISSSQNVARISGWNGSGTMQTSFVINYIHGTNYIYFDNSVSNFPNNIYFVIGHDYSYSGSSSKYSKAYKMTQVTDTKLYYVKVTDEWKDATYFAVIADDAASISADSWGSGDLGTTNKGDKGYTAAYKTVYNMEGGSFMLKAASAGNNKALSIDYVSGYGSIQQYTSYSKVKKRDTGTTYTTITSGTWPATINMTGRFMSNNGTSGYSTASTNTGASGSYSNVVTALVEMAYSSLSSSYYFEGWGGDVSAPTITTATHSYNITANTTTFAFFSKKYTLSYDLKGTYGSSSLDVSIADFSGTKTSGSSIPTGHTITFTASPTSGYAIEGWYSDAECTISLNNGRNTTYTISSLNANTSVYVKFAAVKNISVYVYVGGCTSDQINSIELFGTPYVGSVALDAVHYYIGDFTIDGNWRKYTFTNVSEIQNLVVARSGGRAVDNITATADVYAKWDGTSLDGKCIPRANPTWGTAPASGAIGGSMTATVSGAPDGATITWSSTATSYATVNSSGEISYVAAGSATIKAHVQKAASGDYCALDYTLSQDITVTSGATVSATRACPEYVSTNSGQVKLDISSTGASTGWYYRVCNSTKTAYYAPDEQSAASNTLSWTMNGSLLTGSNTLVVELYNSARQLVCTSSSVTVNVEIAESVTISAGANGSVSPSGTVYANNNHVHPTITAIPNEHYHFKNWTSSNTAASVADANNATTTVTATASGYTITANFAGDQYTITYKDQGDVAYSGSNEGSLPATHTYGTATALVNGTKNGYNFVGWYTDASCTISAGSSIGATAKTSNFTLYAKWTENMSSLSTSCSYDAGTPGYAAPTVSNSATNVGYVTTRTITATAAGTGYTFAGWTLTNCTRTDGGGATANPITIRSNGDGEDVSVVANYTEVLTTNWKLIGDNQTGGPFGDDYTYSSGKAMSKKTGHSTESNAYVTVNVTKIPADNYGFKVATSNSNSDKWGYGESDGYYIDFNRSASDSKKQVYSGNQHQLRFYPDALGEYEFRVNYPGNKYVYVTFPTAYTVTFSRGTVDGASGTVTAEYSSVAFSTGTKVQSGKSVTFKAPAAKTGYTFQGWYTVNNGSGSTNRVSTEQNYITTITADKALYACYTINNHAITHSDASHGSYTIKVGSAAAVSTNTTSDYGKTITLAATPATGYHFGSWSAYKTGTPGTTVTVSSNQFTMPDYAVTVGATFSPNTYRVQFHRNGASEATVYQNFTYDVAQNLTANTYTRTGYTFGGWATSKERADAGTVDYTDGQNVNNLTSTNDDTYHLYAKWNAKQCTINFDFDATDPGHGSHTSATTSTTATYAAAMTSVTPPTAANGWAFMGYFDAADGEGTQYYTSTGASARTWDKNTQSPTTLYAYYKKAEITNLVAAPGVIAPGETITITPTIEPTPTGTTKVCYELQYSNGTPLPSQPTFTPGVGNAVSFPVPSASATYIIQATLAKGSSCPADPGDVLSTRTTTFQVAGEHTVTIRYQDSDGRTLQASSSIEARPLTWTTDGDIMPPTITGYTFVRWDAGDGVTIKNGDSDPVTTTTTSSIQIKATYDGTLTAVYSKKRMIYFNNTLGWSSVYVYFYKNDSYWESSGSARGSGAKTTSTWTDTPYSEGKHGQMLPVSEGSNIYYFDAEAAGVNASYDDVVFTKDDQDGYEFFYATKAVRRGDYKTSLPMFVPVDQTPSTHNNTDYYNKGYWMNYPENTGYVLHVYSGTTYGTSDQLQEIPFEFTADKTLPMSVNVELNAKTTYGFEIHRADGTKLGENEYTLQSGNSGDEGQTVRTLGESERSKITTTVAGDYTFKLNYGKVSSNYYYLIGVHYPVTTGDYRVLYTDDATWSMDAHSPEYVWYHESRTIHKENGAEDIVSFYVKVDSDTKMKFQYASSINESTGAVTWTDVTSGNIDLSSIKKDGVYNFYLTQADGSISVSKIEPYTGKYYIRTDCAGATKWENFRTTDHEMTYSDYTETNHGYSHYYPHWVEATKNVKFCIANDYSPCITDTLVEDYGTVIANIDAGGYLQNYGANIRFMWNQSTNKIWRAYIGGSGDITDRFLVLEGDAKLYDENGNPLTEATGNRDHITYNPGTGEEVTKYLDQDNQVILHDDENFVYERTIQVNTGARAKLTAKYNNNVQYFRGSAGDFAEGTTVELLGGEASGKHTMRIVYDFKTNRLVTAYIPSGTIEDNIAINADLMIVREHQNAGQQLIFNGGSLSEVKTVYGVMRFNRWTLNNKSTAEGHAVLGDPKSPYERGLYWISFPFDVNLGDVFGFGTYGVDWIIMEYDGAERASKGYWKDSDGFWKYITSRTGKVLEAGKGYVLALDLDRMRDNNTDFWSNNIEQVELFFPSTDVVENIEATDVTTSVDEHECTIDRTGNNGSDINKNRTKADSHWNLIGVPSYANYGTELTSDGSTTITWNSTPGAKNNLPFLYEWNMVDNTYTVQSGTTYPFKAMHAYMVQYHGDLYWSLASATPTSSIVARRTYAEEPQNVEFRLELQQNDKMIDQTFVKLSNDEKTSGNFIFDEDLCKEYNGTKANIYTFIEGYIPAAGNTLPMSEQTTVIPVGVQIKTDGEYTFAMPAGTDGVGVTLIDNVTNTRTNLGLTDYTVTLSSGTIDGRFILEISPIAETPTNIEAVSDQNSAVRKVMIDGILYIVKDNRIYDATGALVK